MRRHFYILLFGLLPLLCGELYAQKLTAAVSKSRVAVGEVFQLDFTINASGRGFSPPSLSDFNIYSGPNQSTSVQIVNGSMSQTLTFSYYLAAKKEGTFIIGAASVSVGGHVIQSNPVNIEVVKAGSGTSAGSASQQKNSGQGNSENLFARTHVSKSKVYVGEQVQVVHKVYTRMNLKGFQDIKLPSYNGFWAQEASRNAQYEVTTENIDGINYNVVEIKRTYLFAQRTGKIEIEPMVAECIVREKTGRGSDPLSQIFGNDPFFGMSSYRDVPYSIKSNALSLEVLPLPAGQPDGFSGAVGQFSVQASVDKEKVKANEGINLKITISGKGNIKLADAPKMEFPDEFESYDPKSSENISTGNGSVTGNKTFEYLIVPRHEGIYKITPGEFSYFDPEKKTYVTLPSREFTITVEKGDGSVSANLPSISSPSKEEVKMVGQDIRFIKSDSSTLRKKGDYFYSSPYFFAGMALSPLLFLAFVTVRRRHIQRNSDLVAVRNRNARKIARKLLSAAERSMKEQNKEKFFENVLGALNGYAANKMNIPVADLSREKITGMLKEKNVPEDLINAYSKLMDECEFARYAPGLQSGDLSYVFKRAEEIITETENKLS